MKKYLIALAGVFALGTAALTSQASAASYSVEKGDTLWSISKSQDISVEDLQQWNGLESDLIIPNQQLEIESKSADTSKDQTYKIKKGDTLTAISAKKNVSIENLKAFNNLTSSDLIFAGDTLALTEEAATQKVITSVATEQTPANTQQTATKKTVTSQSTASSGRTLTVTATAYTPNCSGCSGVTATGINVKANPNMKVIAVDPSIIPLGSTVWVEGYGTAIAGDTGGAIKGNKIDLLMPNNSQANSWGVRSVTIKVLN